jgi:5'-nucleotidase
MNKHPLSLRVAVLTAAMTAALLGGCAADTAAPARADTTIHLVALNDFHGHLEASKFVYRSASEAGEKTITAGGIDSLAAALQAYRREDPNLLFVGAGDLVGASPAMSSMWADEPSLVALNMLGMNLSSLGNHEFDQGRVELMRKQTGGCASPLTAKACKYSPEFKGAAFTYLAANVTDSATGKPFMPAYAIREVKGVKIAFIGAVLRDIASVVTASGIAGLSFGDEADAINKAAVAARAEGATVFVVLIHEGGNTTEAYDQPQCSQLKGPIVGIAHRLDPAIRLIISGHTHKGFQCEVEGRTITQAQMGGHVLSRIDLDVDANRQLRRIDVRNVPVVPGQYPLEPKAAAFLAEVKARSMAALARPIARVESRSVGRHANPAGETPLGGMIADAVVDATRAEGVQIGFMNNGGMRADFDVGPDLVATFGQAQVVLPFANTLVVMDMTGAQLRALLEEQFQRPDGSDHAAILQVSSSLRYRWDNARPAGAKVVPGSITVNGAPLLDGKTYRVVANNFLAEGGDGFPTFARATNKHDTNIVDIDAFTALLVKRQNSAASTAPRIERLN